MRNCTTPSCLRALIIDNKVCYLHSGFETFNCIRESNLDVCLMAFVQRYHEFKSKLKYTDYLKLLKGKNKTSLSHVCFFIFNSIPQEVCKQMDCLVLYS